MVEELLNITLGEVGGKSEAQTDTDSELRIRPLDGPGKNGLAEIFGPSYGADWVALISAALGTPHRRSGQPCRRSGRKCAASGKLREEHRRRRRDRGSR
jgi:hypothetical protein